MSVITTLDMDLKIFLEAFLADPNNENTLVMLVADHGSHGSLYWMFTEVSRSITCAKLHTHLCTIIHVMYCIHA